jgi:hypothetical protein
MRSSRAVRGIWRWRCVRGRERVELLICQRMALLVGCLGLSGWNSRQVPAPWTAKEYTVRAIAYHAAYDPL